MLMRSPPDKRPDKTPDEPPRGWRNAGADLFAPAVVLFLVAVLIVIYALSIQ